MSKQYLECGWNDYVSVTLKDKKYLDNYNEELFIIIRRLNTDHTLYYNFSNKSEDHKNSNF